MVSNCTEAGEIWSGLDVKTEVMSLKHYCTSFTRPSLCYYLNFACYTFSSNRLFYQLFATRSCFMSGWSTCSFSFLVELVAKERWMQISQIQVTFKSNVWWSVKENKHFELGLNAAKILGRITSVLCLVKLNSANGIQCLNISVVLNDTMSDCDIWCSLQCKFIYISVSTKLVHQ